MTAPLKHNHVTTTTRPLRPSSDRIVGVICVDGKPVIQTRSAVNIAGILALMRQWRKRADEKRAQENFEV